MPGRVRGRLAAATALLIMVSCGVPERDNPLDPGGGADSSRGILLSASLPAGQIPAERVVDLRFEVTMTDPGNQQVVLASGLMSLIGRTARATVRGVPAGASRLFRVDAFDDASIRTLSAEQLVDVAEAAPSSLHLQLERLTGDLELTADLPPEVATIEVVVAADGDSLRRAVDADQAAVQRISGIPTGSDVAVVLRVRDVDQQVLLEQHLTADIRDGLLARVAVVAEGGALGIVAHFPEYIPIVRVDRFSDGAATLFRRSDHADLPGAGEPIDFDQWPFRLTGLGPNGEPITLYNFDLRSAQPAPVYVAVDRRGVPVPGQLPIFDHLPGDPGHSDLWEVHQVRAAGRGLAANEVTSLEQIQQRRDEVVPTGTVMNCVMVPDGSRCSLRYAPDTPAALQDGWYRGQIVKYFLFEHPASVATVAFSSGSVSTPQMYAFLENDTDLLDGFARDVGGSTRNVVSVLPGQGEEADYSPLWLVRVLRLNAFEQVENLATASLQTGENINDTFTGLTLNAPVVRVE